ncbi:MAG: GTP-binding protein [Patescibacteria group bacterium]
MIPISILTGFLGAGKTTLVNQIVKDNPQLKFGFIINEFGEVGIDGQLIETTGEEMVEMSNGCLCCVVRKDLQDAVLKLVESGRVDYIIVEASGLAEPMPIAQTFAMDNLEGKVSLDAVICVVDSLNYLLTKENYTVAIDQLTFGDIIILNKTDEQEPEKVEALKELIKKVNPAATILENTPELDTKLLIDTGAWDIEKLTADEKDQAEVHEHHHDDHDHEHHHDSDDHHEHHHHEHDDVDEVVFTTTNILDPAKLDTWLQNDYPSNAIRAKGFLRLQLPNNQTGLFVFQIVGAKKSIEPFKPTQKNFDYNTSRMVFIGKHLDKQKIIDDLRQIVGS